MKSLLKNWLIAKINQHKILLGSLFQKFHTRENLFLQEIS